MNVKRREITYIVFFISLFFFPWYLISNECFENRETIDSIYSNTIRSVQFHLNGWELSYPLITLRSDNVLKLSFDDLDVERKEYSYTLVQCDAEWNPSLLIPEDYLDGFFTNQIRTSMNSFNTTFDYMHYELLLPNEDVQIKLSGNYIIKVYEGFIEEDVVMIKRFMVVDPKVKIIPDVKRSAASDYFMKGQEIDFKIDHANYFIQDPILEIKIVITQNNRWDNAIRGLQPLFIKESELVYDYTIENVFLSGNEYRAIDLKSLDYLSERIKSIDYIEPYFHITLKPDESRAFKSYIYEQDFNGKYYIEVEESRNKDTDADYVYVYFSLPVKTPIIESDVYIFGALTNWKCNKRNKMTYNYEKRQYELMLLLKQGYYNYQYTIIDPGMGFIDNTYMEGSHFETENDYIIYVYKYDWRLNYDQLIGVKIVNSLIEK